MPTKTYYNALRIFRHGHITITTTGKEIKNVHKDDNLPFVILLQEALKSSSSKKGWSEEYSVEAYNKSIKDSETNLLKIYKLERVFPNEMDL